MRQCGPEVDLSWLMAMMHSQPLCAMGTGAHRCRNSSARSCSTESQQERTPRGRAQVVLLLTCRAARSSAALHCARTLSLCGRCRRVHLPVANSVGRMVRELCQRLCVPMVP